MKIGIIIGSVRETRNGEQVARWFEEHARKRDDAEFEVIDLREFDVPVFTSETNPMVADRDYASEAVRRWSAAIDRCDGFVFVTPEYNHGVPGAFKNAVDSLGPEWVQKTVAFVSYGADNGVRAVEQWRQIIANFQMVDVRAQVSMTIFGEVTADGVNPAERREDEVQNLLDQLIAATARSLS